MWPKTRKLRMAGCFRGIAWATVLDASTYSSDVAPGFNVYRQWTFCASAFIPREQAAPRM
ncbi:hypothetical protein BJ982_004637 [Sphaerisporangium siamense]|uniref:Uncharacterized protein n=1 Tax=Sphaerisporangium siamense TaxID=795645 RepID=A0A7W7DA61_9ACTN|nr:hypothetical protein [Sphaerisporangium siamense]